MDRQNIIEIRNSLEENIVKLNNNVLTKFPKDKYVGYLKSYPRISTYGYVSREIESLCKNLLNESSEQALEVYHKLILVELMIQALENLKFKRFPSEIEQLYEINFDRILQGVKSGEFTGFYNYSHDMFKKDLALCNMKLIPAGAQKLNLARVPRKFLFRNGARQFLRGLVYIITELRGTTLFDMHTDSYDRNLLAEFTEEGWRAFLRRTAELLELYPDVKGVFGSAWVVDPKIEEISPRLGYVRRLFTECGGVHFFNGISATGIQDAIAKSATRKQLYETGKYMPRNYLSIVSRRRLIAWAKRGGNR